MTCERCTELRAELAAADQNLKTMLQAAGEEAERQLAAAREEIAVRDASISDYARQMADIREHWHAEATENVTFKADLAAEKARADRAEERVCVLEQEIVSWRNAQSVHFLGESGEREAAPRRRDAEIRLNVIADTILAARARKEGGSR